MIVARFCWVSFSAPSLTPKEEESLALALRETGKKPFVRSFLGLTSVGKFVEVQFTGLFYLTFILAGIYLIVWDPKELPGWGEVLVKVVATVFAVSCIAFPIFFLSMVSAAFSYSAWLNSILRRYPP
jgi:hypothetical protein